MVKMLSLTADEMTDGALTPVVVDDDRVARAAENLEHRIDVVGLQEHFEEFCTDLGRRSAGTSGEPLFMNRTPPAEAPDALRERIGADNDHDLRLYALALARWEERHLS